jgi:murein DD-endopeptidase MepM/ murein hydrolase activator NlpD
LNQFKDRDNRVRRPSGVNRFIVLAIACVVFIVCGVTANASNQEAEHKDLGRLATGLKSVKEAAKRAKTRLAALDKREDVLLAKIDEAKDENPSDESDGTPLTISFAKAELEKIRFERRALTKKLKSCELNEKCILAEMEVISVPPVDPLQQEIQFKRPIKGRITSGFGMRLHPLEHTEKVHQGIDLAGEIGDPVKAASSGRVTFAGVQRVYGNIIIIQHSENLSSAYGHLSAMNVEVGESVTSGQIIGEVGMSGNSTGPHLHFEIRENGEPVNPIKYLS